VWRILVDTPTDRRRVDVDAHDGSIRGDVSTIRLASRSWLDHSPPDVGRRAPGTPWAPSPAHPAGNRVSIVTDGDSVTAAATSVAAANVTAACEYLRRRFGRRGVDGHDGPVSVMLHSGRDAGWDGQHLLFGRAHQDRPLSAAMDVVVRSAIEALLDLDVGFEPTGEAARLAAGLADVLAESDRDRPLPTPAGAAPVAQRLRSPRDAADVVGLVYSLAIDGGRDPVTGVAVRGAGEAHRAALEQALYRSWVYMLTPRATLEDARETSLQSARDVCGEGSPVSRALADAWQVVMVSR
jgi:hypothetical protein